MTEQQVLALLPLMLIAATSVLVMLVAAWVRHPLLLNLLAVAGTLLTLASLVPVAQIVPQGVTPLVTVDQFALFYMALLLLAGLVVLLLARDYFATVELGAVAAAEYYVLLLVALLGALVMVCANHFAAFFIGLELLGVSVYVLVAYLCAHPGGRTLSLEAGVKYLILSGVASALLLFGMALLYAEFGVLTFDALGQRWQHLNELQNLFAAAGLGMVLAGVAFKLSLVPFHMWTPDVYEGAPAPTAAFIATVSKGAVIAFLVRFFIATGAYENSMILLALALFAIASMLGGNLLALLQQNVKRLLAYSSIAHIGYLLVAFLAAGWGEANAATSAEAVAFYLVAYFVSTLGAFAVISLLSQADALRDLDSLTDYRGLFWRAPWLAAVLTGMLLSLAGIPLTVGFVGKFYLFTAGVSATLWWLLAALVVGSAIGLYYYLRWIQMIFSDPQSANEPEFAAPRLGGQIVLALLAFLLLYLGVYPEPMMRLILQMGLL